MTSKIKVDNIENQCGGAVVTKCGGTTTISGTVVKSNTLQASDAGNIISQSGTTITLGASGDTINLASGASQSGFGREGSVNWDTTAKTSTFTAVSGNGYFVNTTAGVITVNLPAGSAGAIVAVNDYARTSATNNITINSNGSEKIESSTTSRIISTNGVTVTLVYVDGTQGWKVVDSGEISNLPQLPLFTVATGGTITTCGNFKIHTFTGTSSLCVSQVGNCVGGPGNVDYLVIAGGGAGGQPTAGGGGAGGYRTTFPSPGCNAGTFPISVQNYPIIVDGGGSGAASSPTNGGNSTFSTITSTGGGRGTGPGGLGADGGSGAGNSGNSPNGPGTGGAGNTPPVSPPQGNPGGNSSSSGPSFGSGGGGGAGSSGGNGPIYGAGAGGSGSANSITGSSVTRAGGGGGATFVSGSGGTGGSGGGGAGVSGPSPAAGGNGTANTGSGGGGAAAGGNTGGNGGSGIVIIRYKFQ